MKAISVFNCFYSPCIVQSLDSKKESVDFFDGVYSILSGCQLLLNCILTLRNDDSPYGQMIV